MIFLYLTIMLFAGYWAVKLLGPEYAKPLPKSNSRDVSPIVNESSEMTSRVEKLETLLAEKNKNINLLQNELKLVYVQVRESYKVKTLLEEEIHRLKEQNRIFRSELGMPSIPASVNQTQVPESSTKTTTS